MDLVKRDYGTILEEKGKDIYKKNQTYRNLASVMEHPEFRQFYDKYMEDADIAKTMIMFMKIYKAIETHSNVVLTPYQKIAIVKDTVEDPEKRRQICSCMNDWYNSEKSEVVGTNHAKYLEE